MTKAEPVKHLGIRMTTFGHVTTDIAYCGVRWGGGVSIVKRINEATCEACAEALARSIKRKQAKKAGAARRLAAQQQETP